RARDAGGGMSGARAGHSNADAHLAGGTGVAIRHEGPAQLVPHQDMLDLALLAQRVVQTTVQRARDAEDVLHPLRRQPAHDPITPRHPLIPFTPWRGYRSKPRFWIDRLREAELAREPIFLQLLIPVPGLEARLHLHRSCHRRDERLEPLRTVAGSRGARPEQA